MKKILVNVNEENLELVREQWIGVRGYRLSNSDIVNELLAKEVMLKVLKQARFTSTPPKEKSMFSEWFEKKAHEIRIRSKKNENC